VVGIIALATAVAAFLSEEAEQRGLSEEDVEHAKRILASGVKPSEYERVFTFPEPPPDEPPSFEAMLGETLTCPDGHEGPFIAGIESWSSVGISVEKDNEGRPYVLLTTEGLPEFGDEDATITCQHPSHGFSGLNFEIPAHIRVEWD